MQRIDFACPTCSSELLSDNCGYRCTVCTKIYPKIGKTIPVLLEYPEKAIVDGYIDLKRERQRGENTCTDLEFGVNLSSPRIEILQRAVFDIKIATSVLKQFEESLRGHVTPDSVAEYILDSNRRGNTGYPNPFSYARRDWGGLPQYEEEITRVLDVMHRHIAQVGSLGESVTVLGAGLARYACELLGSYERVIAIERSFSMALLFDALLERDIEVSTVDFNDCRSSGDFGQRTVLSLSHLRRRPKIPENIVSYAIGDAARIPVPDSSQTAIVSIFFTDVVPLFQTIAECRRILKPGGVFSHFGPLSYHANVGAPHRLSVDEVRRAFCDSGFTIIDESWHPGFHIERAANMRKTWYENWAFAARYDGVPICLSRLPFSPGKLQLRQGVQIEATHKLDPTGSSTVVRATLKDCFAQNIEIDSHTAELLLSIVGNKNTTDAIENRMKSSLTDFWVSRVGRDIQMLINRGILLQAGDTL